MTLIVDICLSNKSLTITIINRIQNFAIIYFDILNLPVETKNLDSREKSEDKKITLY